MRKLVVLAFLAAGIAALFAIPAAANPRGTNGKIVTHSFNTALGQDQVYSVDPDGSDFTLLVDNSAAGQWSHDGSRITVGNDVLGQAIFDFDTGVLTSLNLGAQYPDLFLPCGVWSPDDKRLACEGYGQTDPSLTGIYTVRSSDGGDVQRVTSEPGGDCPSDYSPNGKRILFERWSVGELFTVKLDGSGLRQITPDGMALDECPGSWSPQGNEILFSAHVPDADHRGTIWVVHSDGTGLRQIPVPGCGGLFSDPTSIGCFNPSWSPDGQKIVFGRRPGQGQRDLYTVNADGSGLFRVTNTPNIDEFGGDWGTHPVTP
jgi:Tol biopolymer transport system component